MSRYKSLKLLILACGVLLTACNTASDIKDAIDLADGVPRKTIDTNTLGTNAFVSDTRFGSISSQFAEVQNTLRLNSVRLLFVWNDAVQSSPSAQPNFGFYDEIVSKIPAGMDAIVVLDGLPGWMNNSANWIDGNPRRTFVELWVDKVAARYASNPRITGWEVWNEPNMLSNPDNTTLAIATNPSNYVELLNFAFSKIRARSPQKLVLSAATTAINQNFPGTLDYNKTMQQAGVADNCDIFSIHYYGRQYENLVRSGGVADFLNDIGKEIWVTESGDQGVNEQLKYGEQTWPFLRDKVNNIGRIYQYQFVEGTPSDVTYGLRNLTPGSNLSDLYIYLRDRP